MSDDYEGDRWICYGNSDDECGGATFVPKCPSCGRYVKADSEVTLDGHGQPVGPNATCKRDGRVEMIFIGYP